MNKIINFVKNNYLWIIFGLCIFIVVSIAEDVYEDELIKYDVLFYNIFVDTIRNTTLTHIMKFFTAFGNSIVVILICLLSFVIVKNKRISICIISNLGIIFIINQILKFIVQRPRPEGFQLINEIGFSFPSGHSMVSVAFYGFIIYLIYKYMKNKKLKIISIISLIVLVLMIGISRIYLGVHYASDVIAGALISIAYLILFVKATNKYIYNNEKKETF